MPDIGEIAFTPLQIFVIFRAGARFFEGFWALPSPASPNCEAEAAAYRFIPSY
jgi:hypothetical protein